VVVLSCIAVVGVMALLVAWQWADVRTLRAAAPLDPAAADVAVTPPSTPMLSFRRAPGVLSRHLNAGSFATALAPVIDRLDATSCLAVSVDGQPIAGVRETMPLSPASNMKLITGAVALDVLGPNFRYTTRVVGQMDASGVVNGDLALVGGGDPVLVTAAGLAANNQRHRPVNTTSLDALADAVVQAGVTRVTGHLVGDASRYDDEHFIPSWDASIHGTSGGPYGALMVDDAEARSGADPALAAATKFATLLRDRGVVIEQPPVAGTASFADEIATIDSTPLAEILQELLLTSDNNTAEMMVKEIGVEASNTGSTVAGLAVMGDRLVSWGVPTDGMELFDGSGLSTSDRVSCAILLGVLQHGSIDDAVGQGLPVAASSGTLADVFGGSMLAGRMRAKTGTLNNVKALSGYVPLEGGGTIEFSLIQNSPNVDDGAYLVFWQKVLGPALVTYPSGPTAAQLAPR